MTLRLRALKPYGRRKLTGGDANHQKRSRRLGLEALESRQMLSRVVQFDTVFPGPPIPLEAEHTAEVVAKAMPDQWYKEIGGRYIPYSNASPGEGYRPKVNYDYVWGMTESRGDIWFAAAGNVGWGFGGAVQDLGIFENSFAVVEGGESQYPLVPRALRNMLGDWRPPRIFCHDPDTGQTVEKTPRDSRINLTLGLRSAGATDEVVLLAGPHITMLGLNVFAFDARNGRYLGSTTLRQYGDIRQWVNVDGQLYAGVLNAFSRTGEGTVIRWKGTRSRPLQFEEVGRLDLEGANICYDPDSDRLFVSTWPLWEGSMMYMLGGRTTATAGIWMSPKLGRDGLRRADARGWTKVWDIGQYESDPVIARTYGGGALQYFDGYLYWGMLQAPTAAAETFLEAYPDADLGPNVLAPNLPVFREAVLFRAKNLHNPATRDVQLLFGDEELMVYTDGQPNPWSLQPNKMLAGADPDSGIPLFGHAGYRSLDFVPQPTTAKTQLYTYTMAVYDDRLYLGTEDFSMKPFGDFYVAAVQAGGDRELAHQMIADTLGLTDLDMGADLWCLFPDEAGQPVAPVNLTRDGFGNPWNFGVRTMIATDDGVYIGTSNASNLLTEPRYPALDPLNGGGWELIHVTAADMNQQLVVAGAALVADTSPELGAKSLLVDVQPKTAADARDAAALKCYRDLGVTESDAAQTQPIAKARTLSRYVDLLLSLGNR